MSRLEKVVFFSIHDAAGSHMLEKAEKVLDALPEFSTMDINSLLEFHHIHKYFENGLYLNRWTSEQKRTYLETVKLALNETKRYFLNLEPGQVAKVLGELDFENVENFWELFRLYETHKRIDRNVFSDVLSRYSHNIRYILRLKQIVDYYNNEIRLFLLNYKDAAELLLSHFEENHDNQYKDYIFPKSLSEQDKHNIITAYLDTDETNLNYVQLAINSKHLKLTPKILLKAKQKAEALEEHYFNEENSTKISVGAALKMDQSEPVVFEKEGVETNAVYGGLYFDSLKSDAELFALFGRLFTYTDREGLIALINKDAEMDNLEKVLMRSKSEYQTGFHFSHKNLLSLTQLGIISHYLARNQRSIENLIENFTQQCFLEQFKMIGLIFKVPDKDASPSDKIRLLAPELEYLLKQFKNFVTDGHIDHELLQIDSTPGFFSEIPSLVNKKYVVGTHQTINKQQQYFFESNGILSGRRKLRDNRNLFQILITDRLMKSELEDYQRHYLEMIVQDGFLNVNENGEIKMVSPITTFIAGQLRENGCLSYWHYSSEIRLKIDELISLGILSTTSKLFSPQETSYLNYYLNKKEFSNGQDLRNKYLHGSNNRTIERQRMDYMYFLRTLILILLKLKDDLELNARMQNN